MIAIRSCHHIQVFNFHGLPDEPEVLVHEPIVLSDEDHRAILACHVFADPDASITWYKNTLLLQKHPRYRHVINLRIFTAPIISRYTKYNFGHFLGCFEKCQFIGKHSFVYFWKSWALFLFHHLVTLRASLKDINLETSRGRPLEIGSVMK